MAARNNHLKFFFMMDDFGTPVGYIPMGREKMIKVTNLLLSDKSYWRSVGIEKPLLQVRFRHCCKIILPANLADNYTQQINHLLLGNPNLFHFVSCSPMLSFLYESESLSAFARLKQRIVGSCKPSFPRNGFGKSRLVKNVVVCEGGRKSQVVGCIWSASDELEVHIAFV